MSSLTPDVALFNRQKENQQPKTKDHTKRFVGSNTPRIPLSPSKQPTPSNVVDDLTVDLKNLSVAQSQHRSRVHPFPSASTSLSASSSVIGGDSVQSSCKGGSEPKPRAYKPIDDYRSPVQLLTRDPDWSALAPQTQHGMLGIGNMPLNLTNVVKHDWRGLKAEVSEATLVQAKEISKSVESFPRLKTLDAEVEVPPNGKQPLRVGIDDRFVHERGEDGAFSGHTLAHAAMDSPSEDVMHDDRLREALDIKPATERILQFTKTAPRPREDPTIAMQRELVKPLYARPGALGTSNGVYTNMTRRIPTAAERILDAPGMINDYYLNLIAWSCTNLVGVALRESVYIWNAETNETEILSTCENENGYVSSVDFSSDGSYSGIGLDSGEVEIWDVETKQKLRTMSGHQGQVSVLSWNHHIISSGCADGSIWHHDVRIANHKVMELLGHTGEVCGLKWRQDGEALASGANDNVVNCWDPRVGTAGSNSRGQPKWSKSVHTAAVKAIAWAPWNMNILASGGGTSDCKINVWSASTGSRLHSLTTPAQVTSVHFSPHSKEIFSTHGFPTNAIMLHSYPALEKITEIRDAHDARILNSAVSPNGDFIVTNSGDENIKFWRIWELPVKKHKKKQNVQLENGLQSIR